MDQSVVFQPAMLAVYWAISALITIGVIRRRLPLYAIAPAAFFAVASVVPLV